MGLLRVGPVDDETPAMLGAGREDLATICPRSPTTWRLPVRDVQGQIDAPIATGDLDHRAE